MNTLNHINLSKSDIGTQWFECVRPGAGELGIALDEGKVALLETYVKELLDASQGLNLTRLTEPLEIAESLILDSIFPGKFLPEAKPVLDLGTGAGLPGIPLKIAYPALSMTLIDGRRKKINFLKHVIRQLGLKDTKARHIRAEDLAEQGARFGIVITRAVSSLKDLIKLALPLLEKEGLFIAMKGSNYQTEIDELRTDAFIHTENNKYNTRKIEIEVERYRLPVSGIDRALIMVRI